LERLKALWTDSTGQFGTYPDDHLTPEAADDPYVRLEPFGGSD
jgi:hypothetical protein